MNSLITSGSPLTKSKVVFLWVPKEMKLMDIFCLFIFLLLFHSSYAYWFCQTGCFA